MFPIVFHLRTPDGEVSYTSARPMATTHGERHPPYGIVFICPKCTDAWARVVSTAFPGYPFTRACEAHGDGSLWIQWDYDHNHSIPRQLLIREFLLAAKAVPDSGAEGAPVGRLGHGEDLFPA